MRRYFVKLRYTATDANTNFAGEINEYLIGKKEFILTTTNPCKWEAVTWGYTRPQDVARAFKKQLQYAEEEQKQGYWTITAEIVFYDYN